MDYHIQLLNFIDQAIREDQGEGDHTSLAIVPEGKIGRAQLLIKEKGVLAGIAIAQEIFKYVDPGLKIKVLHNDGEEVEPGDIAYYIQGSARSILLCERLVLNVMQRMSGIATTTRKITNLLRGTQTKVLDTRKTTPNLRFLEKLAVKIGGGENHRFGLYDMILIKDNHIDCAGSVEKAINSAKAYLKRNNICIPIEIEVRNFQELEQVLIIGGVERIMLDNFDLATLARAVKLIAGKFVTEASGGIREDCIREYGQCGVDFISLGCLTNSVKSLDMSLKMIQ